MRGPHPTEKPENSAGGEAAAGAGGVDGTEACAPGCCPVSAANAAESAQVPLADSRQGFSSTQGQCGWSYGYLPSGKEPLRLLSHFAASEALWEASTEWPPWSAIYRDQQHPNQVPLHWIVRRWTSHVHGPIWIRGRVAKRDVSGGDGIAAQVRVDSQVVWEATVAFDDDVGVSFEVEATVAVGSAVDFIVSPKAGDAHDLTELFASITR